jgi:hypothetical protein
VPDWRVKLCEKIVHKMGANAAVMEPPKAAGRIFLAAMAAQDGPARLRSIV